MATATTRMTVSDIAELAGVQRATVSNWQRRHETFPKPLPDSPPGRPQFDAAAVQTWLGNRGFEKLASDRAVEVVRTWRYTVNHVHCEDGNDPLVILIAAAEGLLPSYREGLWAAADERYPIAIDVRDLDTTIYATQSQADAIREFLATELEGVDKAELIEAAAREFDELGRWRRGPDAVAAEQNLHNLLAELVRDEVGTVLDFACDTGALLSAVSRRHPGATFLGMTPGLVEHFIAQARLEHRTEVEIEEVNILEEDALDGRTFDAVVSIPPFGIKVAAANERMRRLPFGVVRGTADAAWLQLAVQALTPDGEAFLVLPHTVASSERADDVRRQLIQRGLVSAVVTLPPNAHASSKTASDLWVLSERRPSGAEVLFVDYSSVDPTDNESYSGVAHVMANWLDGGPTELSTLPDDDPRYVAMDPVELLGKTVILDPVYWCARASTPTSAPELIGAVEEAAAALDRARRSLLDADMPVWNLSPDQPAMITVRDAREDELLEIVRRGVQHKEGTAGMGRRVLHVADAEAMRRGEPVELDANSTLGRDPFTHLEYLRRGDVLVWVTPDREVRATVCTVSGVAPSGSVTALRCNPEVLDPHYLALVLGTGHNTIHIIASNVNGLRSMELSFPLISIDQQRQVARYAKAAVRIMTAAHDVAGAAEAFQRALADAAGSGSVAIAPGGGDQ